MNDESLFKYLTAGLLVIGALVGVLIQKKRSANKIPKSKIALLIIVLLFAYFYLTDGL